MRLLGFLAVACLLALSSASTCKPKFELIGGECLKRCQKGQIRNEQGVCEKECFLNSTLKDGKCVCNGGFEKVASRECAPVCGENMRRKKEIGCICVKGFEMKNEKCVPITCGENEEARGSKCYCVTGTSRIDGVCTGPCKEHEKRIDGTCQCKEKFERFPEKGGECVKRCGLNSRRKKDGVCVCLLGFEEKPDGSCRKIRCPKNEVLDGNKCYCQEGTSRIDGVCLPPCPEHMKRFDGSQTCSCMKNYEMYKGTCTRRCGRNSSRMSNGKCVCDLGFEEIDGNCKAIRCAKGEILDGNDCVTEGGPVSPPTTAPTKSPPTTQSPPPTTQAPPPTTQSPPPTTQAPPPTTQAPPPTTQAPPPPSCQANAQYVNGQCECNTGFLLNAGVCVDNRPCIERDVVPTRQFQLPVGVLSHVRSCNKRYNIMSREEGSRFCAKIGAELAAPGHMKQLLASRQENCACGWLTFGDAQFVNYQMTAHGCGLRNSVNTCYAKFMGKWGGPGWDVYCFTRGAKL